MVRCLQHNWMIESPVPNSLNNDKVKKVRLRKACTCTVLKSSSWVFLSEKEGWGTEDCTGLKLYLPCLFVYIQKEDHKGRLYEWAHLSIKGHLF